MQGHTRIEKEVVILVLLFFISKISCETTGTKLGYKAGTFKDFVSEKTRVSLACRSNDIMVNLNFSVPFRGLVHAGKKDSGCSFRGDGKLTYSLNVPHAACGTIHVTPQDSFANTLTIRYHHALELEGDEIKTILCKYGTGSIQLG
ncbi:ZP domain-containing protein [Caerostris extrusa]|uniref:ZP domain-containing protein n=1 Tax=Caerostris extrusa TaxID=172846 RepID=A0AAV4SQV3_CAEEX|nr:ZP domain-containing protein [Caerostris extrusa]